jgi:hypothetical protein
MPTCRDFSKRHLCQVLGAFGPSHVVEQTDLLKVFQWVSCLAGRVLLEEAAMKIPRAVVNDRE